MDEFDEIPDLIGLDSTPSSIDSPSNTSSQPNRDISDESHSDAVKDDTYDSSQDQVPSLPSLLVDSPVPLTILTGWLGSGKTTLLHNILDHVSSQGKTVAILQNETSSFMGVEKALQIQDDSGLFGEVLEVRNGCVCCSVRSDFLLAIHDLLSKKAFDYMVLECSGIADVGNLITSVWADKESETGVYLDGVVCVVDGQQILNYTQWDQAKQDPVTTSPTSSPSSGDTPTTSSIPRKTMVQTLMNQLVYADTILVNKMDALVPDPSILQTALEQLNQGYPAISSLTPQQASERRDQQVIDSQKISSKLGIIVKNLVQVNPSVVMYFTSRSVMPIASLLDLSRYHLTSSNVDEALTGLTQHYRNAMMKKTGSGYTNSNPHNSGGATGLDSLAVSDLPTLTYRYKGMLIHTNNDRLISSKYLVKSPEEDGDDQEKHDHHHHDHNHDHGHHHHQTESHHHDHHDHHDSHINPEKADHEDPHGISTIVLQLHAKDFISQDDSSPTNGVGGGSGDDDTSPKLWGLDLHKLKTNLDGLLFSEIQKSMEEEWAFERAEYRNRVAKGENPSDVVDSILRKDYLTREQQPEGSQPSSPSPSPSTSPPEGVSGDILIRDENEEVIYRVKGVFAIQGKREKYYLQAVYNMFDLSTADDADTPDTTPSLDDDPSQAHQTSSRMNQQDIWQPDEPRYCSVIVIGANLRIQRLVDTFLGSL